MMKRFLFGLLFLLVSVTSADSVLQGDIKMTPQNGVNPLVIEPGTLMAFSVTVENLGRDSSSEGTIYIHFAYANPISRRSNSELFRTEEKILPALKPGEKVEIKFSKQHKWPTIFDFIKHNWGMRQYQAEATVGDVEHTIGTAAIAFTMHYYPGPKHELPKVFPSSQ